MARSKKKRATYHMPNTDRVIKIGFDGVCYFANKHHDASAFTKNLLLKLVAQVALRKQLFGERR